MHGGKYEWRDVVMLMTGIGGSWVSAVTVLQRQLLARWEDVGWDRVWVSTSTWCGVCFHEVEKQLGGGF